MARPLPPLNALRAFESAGRHLSFTKAAAELNVTPAAIGHQVKALEELLEVPLFRRLTRALRLTQAGQAALPPLRDGFDKLADAVDLLRAHENSGAITVSLGPAFAAKWLVPRLDRFRAAHPDLDVGWTPPTSSSISSATTSIWRSVTAAAIIPAWRPSDC